MRYISTRGGIAPVGFSAAVMMGLATDGGLLLPESYPAISFDRLEALRRAQAAGSYRYQDCARELMTPFIGDLDTDVFAALVERSYRPFSHPQVAPLIQYGGLNILELFHGPTLAFKDIALQFLGNMFEHLLAKNGDSLNILGATSGDTGSAAIYGVRGKKGINIFILHPHGRVSPVQEMQMTTVPDANVFNIAVDGTFDDAQAIVKTIFSDIPFKTDLHLGAVNSINWARVLAQVVYYVHAWILVNAGKKTPLPVDFAVPTGNFGDIFAGWVARRIMPPGAIRRLILAANANDILARFVCAGDYSKGAVRATISPSMDIQAASNFERYLYYLLDENPQACAQAMAGFAAEGRIDLSSFLDQIQEVFVASAVDEQETSATIRAFYREQGYILDPHSAVGVAAALRHRQTDLPVVCLATAHPAKFGQAVYEATGINPALPPALATLAQMPRRLTVMDATVEGIRNFVAAHAVTAAD